MNKLSQYINPFLGGMLELLKMDKHYVRGEGCYLYDSEGNKYMDCIAAYGALPFGYNDNDIWKAVLDMYSTKEPSFIQPSSMDAAGELAQKLIEIVPEGLKYVTFTNSGAETVEAAIKLCRSATGRRGILAAWNGFHGKTLGALSATGKNSYQSAFGAPIEGFDYINYGCPDELEQTLNEKPGYYAAFIIEPLQGEGGIVEPSAYYLTKAREILKKHNVLMILDEIQTGLGRTGDMFACNHEGICPDVLLLAKSLGGGIVPIGACICTEEVYNEDFATKHSSTFAGNTLSCRVGIKVLEILTNNNCLLVHEAKAKGKTLKKGLNNLKDKYPNLIKSVRGRGLMLGIEFGVNLYTFHGSMLGILAESELLTPVISAHLLNRESLRVAPTLNGNNVIRIEPPLVISEKQCHDMIERIDRMLSLLNEGNSAQFLSFLIDIEPGRKYIHIDHKKVQEPVPDEEGNEGRFAFLVHPFELSSYREFDESLAAYSDEELSRFHKVCDNVTQPFVVGTVKLKSKCGKGAFGDFICILRTVDEFINMPKDKLLEELKSSLNLAKSRGAKIVGLGAFTSVASMGGLYLKNESIPLTTGNSYTVVAAVDAIKYALERFGILPHEASAAVVGAAGSIGRGASILLAETVSSIVLIGNSSTRESSIERLYKVAAEVLGYIIGLLKDGREFRPGSLGYKLLKYDGLLNCEPESDYFLRMAKKLCNEDGPIKVSTEINEILPTADIVLCATSAADKLINPQNIKFGAIVCDVSRPANVSEKVKMERPDVLVIDGGVIEVPGLPNLGWNFGFDQGLAYACMAETMMLALEHRYEHTSLGASGVTLDSILLTRNLSEKHGFKLAKLRSFNKPISDIEWENVLKSRGSVL